ncbi:MAG: TerB family tellurite resistance protein [Pirellulaceae bacterium]|nr:TerB family tellurite resistance protein [Pirellulaceae bacterium]
MTQAELFRNLLIMAAIDGRMTESELRLLSDRATQWDISDDEFEQAIQDAIAGKTELTIPHDPVERAELIQEMICIMAADGQLSEQEKELLAIATTAFGISPVELNGLIDSLLNDSLLDDAI